MFNLFRGLKQGLGSAKYRPLIKYNWNTQLSATNTRELVDSGTAPSYHAGLFFGRGAKFNGVDQDVPVTINADVQTIYARIDDVETFDETSQTLTTYTINSANTNSLHNNYIFYNGIFTVSQKEYLANFPERFLYRENDIIKSYALTQTEIDNVVAYFPMCETDDYVRDLVNYSEGSNIITNGDFTDGLVGWGSYNATIQNVSNSLEIVPSATFGYAHANIAATTIVGKYYLYEIDILSSDSTGNSYLQVGTGAGLSDVASVNIGVFVSLTTKYIIFKATTTSSFIRIAVNGSGKTVVLSEARTKELTGTYQIENNTAAVRDDAINLNKGLQAGSHWVRRKTDGLPISSSFDRIQTDGVGHANTGWTPSGTWQYEEVIVIDGIPTHHVYDNAGNKFTDGVADGTYTVPTVEIVLDEIAFDGTIGVTEKRLANAHIETQIPLNLYNVAVARGLLEPL